METQLDQCKDSAPGPDDINISMIKHLTTPAKHSPEGSKQAVGGKCVSRAVEQKKLSCPSWSQARIQTSQVFIPQFH